MVRAQYILVLASVTIMVKTERTEGSDYSFQRNFSKNTE